MILRSRFLQATALLSGTIIGVGMFALPFVFNQAGFWLGTAELVLLTFVTVMMNLFYGEVVLRTNNHHLLPGFVKLYLGKKWFWVEMASALVGFIGGLFVYILLGGTFLANLFGVEHFVGQIAFFMIGGALLLANLKTETRINYVLTIFMVLFIIILSVLAFRGFSYENINYFNSGSLFVPYGVILFSLAGGAVIPEIAAFLGEKRSALPRVLSLGVIIPALIYFLFVLGVVGATGSATTPEALEGLRPFVGRPLFFLGNAIGLLAAFTSFIMFGFVFEDILRADFNIKRHLAWFIVVAAPAALFILPMKDFISVMGFLGAVAIGVDSVFILWLYRKAQVVGTRHPEFSLNMPLWAVLLFGILFFIGFAAPFI